jgi:hypothetical protein
VHIGRLYCRRGLLMFCSIGRYSHICLGVRHVGIFVGTHIALFIFVKTPCKLSWGLVGVSHPHGEINNSNLMLSLEGVPKLTH